MNIGPLGGETRIKRPPSPTQPAMPLEGVGFGFGFRIEATVRAAASSFFLSSSAFV